MLSVKLASPGYGARSLDAAVYSAERRGPERVTQHTRSWQKERRPVSPAGATRTGRAERTFGLLPAPAAGPSVQRFHPYARADGTAARAVLRDDSDCSQSGALAGSHRSGAQGRAGAACPDAAWTRTARLDRAPNYCRGS